jgi:two-component system chemotaxis response regulator CheY
MRAIIRGMLETIGCTDFFQDDGRRALAMLHERKFGLVISDLYMQPVGGMALLHAVRASQQLAHIPFILITGGATRDLVLEAKRLDVDGYLAKPFSTEMLAKKMREALRRHNAPAETPPDSGEPAELRAGIAVLMTIIERRIAAAELALDDTTIELLASYLDRAIELGLEGHHAEAFATLCGMLRATIGTDIPPVTPTHLAQLGEEGIAFGTTARPVRRELRRHRRFTSPVLEATIFDHTYRTANWSCDGIEILGYGGSLAPGRTIEAAIRPEGSGASHAVFRDKLVVMRNDAVMQRLSATFMPRSWTGLKLLEQLIHSRLGGQQQGGLAA